MREQSFHRVVFLELEVWGLVHTESEPVLIVLKRQVLVFDVPQAVVVGFGDFHGALWPVFEDLLIVGLSFGRLLIFLFSLFLLCLILCF